MVGELILKHFLLVIFSVNIYNNFGCINILISTSIYEYYYEILFCSVGASVFCFHPSFLLRQEGKQMKARISSYFTIFIMVNFTIFIHGKTCLNCACMCLLILASVLVLVCASVYWYFWVTIFLLLPNRILGTSSLLTFSPEHIKYSNPKYKPLPSQARYMSLIINLVFWAWVDLTFVIGTI